MSFGTFCAAFIPVSFQVDVPFFQVPLSGTRTWVEGAGGLTATQREAPFSQPLIGGFWRSLATCPCPARVPLPGAFSCGASNASQLISSLHLLVDSAIDARRWPRRAFAAGESMLSHDGLFLVVPVLGIGILAPLLVVPLLGPEMAASFPRH